MSWSAGQISTESPRTRNLPRAGSKSLRAYWLLDELAQGLVAVDRLARLEEHDALEVVLGRAEAVDAAHAGDDDDVAAQEERRRRRVPQPVDLVVDRRVLLDVQVLGRDVRLGLVVVVVADEVLDRVLRQELAELVAELRGEGLVVGDDERGLLGALDDVRHRERLARPGHAQQCLIAVAARDAGRQRGDRLGLVAGESVARLDAEVGHGLGSVAPVGIPRLYQHEHTFATPRDGPRNVTRTAGRIARDITAPVRALRRTRAGTRRSARATSRTYSRVSVNGMSSTAISPSVRAAQRSTFRGAGVVGGERLDERAVVAVEQEAQVVRAVADVDAAGRAGRRPRSACRRCAGRSPRPSTGAAA